MNKKVEQTVVDGRTDEDIDDERGVSVGGRDDGGGDDDDDNVEEGEEDKGVCIVEEKNDHDDKDRSDSVDGGGGEWQRRARRAESHRSGIGSEGEITDTGHRTHTDKNWWKLGEKEMKQREPTKVKTGV